jgi:3-deoxy-D-arabino-heptulosonate 7-phosphate (DAHP) synthase class II
MKMIIDSPFVIGRICGQFGKPRSTNIEVHPQHGHIPVFRGDIINSLSSRKHEPWRMIEAQKISKSMYSHLIKASKDKIFTSHECLLLDYESSLVREWGFLYSTSAHFLWIGDRTRDLNGAHVEFCRGIRNPIGLKVGPSADPIEIMHIIERLNPGMVPGKVTIITRFGVGGLGKLRDLIQCLKKTKHPVLWQCDPMHGNTIQAGGLKTRRVDDIKQEILETLHCHWSYGTKLHGIHLETTGADVTECIGCGVGFKDLPSRYETACDPRLNPEQTKDVLQFLSQLIDNAPKTIAYPLPTRQTTNPANLANVSTDEENIV